MRASDARSRYDTEAKATARNLALQMASRRGTESVLDLYGGGASARAIRQALPDAVLTSCEVDQQLWPTLRLDAQQLGFAYHLGDFRKAKGRYDWINLDLCAQWCGSVREAVIAASRMLTDRGLLTITLLRARESPEIAADRWFLVPASLERATQAGIRLLYPYQSGSPMWMFALVKGAGGRWVSHRNEQFFGREVYDRVADVEEHISEYGLWTDSYGLVDYLTSCEVCDKPLDSPIPGKSKKARALQCGCDKPKWKVSATAPSPELATDRQAAA